MSRSKPIPGTRLLLSLGSAVGLYRAIDETAHELRAPKEEIDPENRSEPDDIHPKALAILAITLILTLWAIIVVLYPLFTYFKYERTGGKQPAKVLQYAPKFPPQPRNEHDPFLVLKKFREREDSELSSYRWVDRSKGIVSIPIDRAMHILAERGVPPSKPAPGNEYWEPRAASLLTGFEGKVEPESR